MSPYKSPPKPVTPSSVKALMVLEALVLLFLSAWMTNEYMNNIFMQQYVNDVVIAHLTTYTIAIGLGIGLGGTAVAVLFWRSLTEAKTKLERIPTPRLKATVKQALSMIPLIDEESGLTETEIPTVENAPAHTDTAQEAPQNSSASESELTAGAPSKPDQRQDKKH